MLKFLFLFFIAIYLFGYIAKFILARWIKKVTNQNMQQNTHQYKKEGEVTVNSNTNKNNTYNTKDGEYVDYEEIKD